MCGIVGYVGKRPVQELLLEGLTRLEYRGYDSAGISMIAGGAGTPDFCGVPRRASAPFPRRDTDGFESFGDCRRY